MLFRRSVRGDWRLAIAYLYACSVGYSSISGLHPLLTGYQFRTLCFFFPYEALDEGGHEMQNNQHRPPQPPSNNPIPNLMLSRQVAANAFWPVGPAPAQASAPTREGPFTFQRQATVPMLGRTISELGFRIPKDIDLSSGKPTVNGSFEEIVSEDDLFSTFMDIDKIGTKLEGSGSGLEGGLCRDWAAENSGALYEGKIDNAGGGVVTATTRPKHRQCKSVDGSSISSSAVARGDGVFGEVLEAKKAMSAEQLAELAAIDPKRAKRVIANRQSAARSKERKARHVSELERKLRALQTEATTLSAQLMLFQTDTRELSAENLQLLFRLQAMEKESKMDDAKNGSLKHEVLWLKIITGEASSSSEANIVDRCTLSFEPSSFFTTPQQRPSFACQPIQWQPNFHQPMLPATNHHLLSHRPHFHFDMMQQDPPRNLQGLDMVKGSLTMKSENSTISARALPSSKLG
ncbi:transcription factor RF2b-like [Phalaenopsis equestris]|uniref:transcription factor RF2b-like n=1 Tax=Phalaenopsis equestris TaxID=78828 RepID=UPI0009E21364|nr:transcription factor RF2b-like [Phalaenopsis equestris]